MLLPTGARRGSSAGSRNRFRGRVSCLMHYGHPRFETLRSVPCRIGTLACVLRGPGDDDFLFLTNRLSRSVPNLVILKLALNVIFRGAGPDLPRSSVFKFGWLCFAFSREGLCTFGHDEIGFERNFPSARFPNQVPVWLCFAFPPAWNLCRPVAPMRKSQRGGAGSSVL